MSRNLILQRGAHARGNLGRVFKFAGSAKASVQQRTPRNRLYPNLSELARRIVDQIVWGRIEWIRVCTKRHRRREAAWFLRRSLRRDLDRNRKNLAR
ncbi:hypothetical protein OF83DRAFT_1134967 [Amylostereum chailletii]|nr:hypothetical protein OF83DRAFT_1134967 [Amylostereum chailletii]